MSSQRVDPVLDTRSVIGVLIPILREEICGVKAENGSLDEETLRTVSTTAKKHDVLHLVADHLMRYRVCGSSELFEICKREKAMAQYRYIHQNLALTKVSELFEAEHIEFIPLKGAVTRDLYPEPWMRTCSDIDILIRQSDEKKAVDLLQEKLNAKHAFTGSHDIVFNLFSNVRLELHYRLMEENRANHAFEVLSDVWQYALGDTCRKRLRDDMLYFYHIAHMAKHFEGGGCGIRPFIDLWLMNHRKDFDRSARRKLLEKGGLSVFAEKAEAISEKWFSGMEPEEDLVLIENYILSGNSFGSMKRSLSIRKRRQGKKGYVVSRMFVDYDYLKKMYPVLEDHRILFPVFEVVRWFRFFEVKSRRHTAKELRILKQDISDEEYSVLRQMGL